MIWSMACGSYTLYAIEDGWFLRDPLAQFPDSDPEVWRRCPEWLVDGQIRISVGCFLLAGDAGVTMIDAGAGGDPSFLGDGAVTGQMPQALAMLGIRPEDVGTVIHTHLHLDHVGGDRSPSGEPFFPEARVLVQRAELDHWAAAGGEQADRIRLVTTAVASRLEPVDGEHEVAPGISLVPTPGHTPGHQSVVVMSRGTRTFVSGDVTHHPVQASFPEWGIPFDVDRQKARQTRERMFEEVAGRGTVLAAGHYPRPGLGYVETIDGTRVFVTGTPVQVA